jgi:YggT family protein
VGLLSQLIGLYVIVLIARIILTWFPVPYDHPVASIRRIAVSLTDPVLIPIRRMLPPVQLGGVALDLAPILLIVGLRLLQGLLIIR